MIEQTLEKVGFSHSEIKVYLYLLRKGSSYAAEISFMTRLNRTNVYEALDRLIAKGVVSFITRNKMKWFEANNPNSLQALIEKQEEELEEIKKELNVNIEQLTSRSISKPLEATIFVGEKGLRMLFEEILETTRPISIIGAELQFRDFFGSYFESWHKRRIKKKISQRTIFPVKLKDKVPKRKLLQYKFVRDEFTNPTTTIIFGDTCLFIQWSKDPIAIKIKNKEITKSHLNYFNMLWTS